jgi:hypothetical protein
MQKGDVQILKIDMAWSNKKCQDVIRFKPLFINNSVYFFNPIKEFEFREEKVGEEWEGKVVDIIDTHKKIQKRTNILDVKVEISHRIERIFFRPYDHVNYSEYLMYVESGDRTILAKKFPVDSEKKNFLFGENGGQKIITVVKATFYDETIDHHVVKEIKADEYLNDLRRDMPKGITVNRKRFLDFPPISFEDLQQIKNFKYE